MNLTEIVIEIETEIKTVIIKMVRKNTVTKTFQGKKTEKKTGKEI